MASFRLRRTTGGSTLRGGDKIRGTGAIVLEPLAAAIVISVPTPSVARHLIPTPVVIQIGVPDPVLVFGRYLTPDPAVVVIVATTDLVEANPARVSEVGLELIYTTDPALRASQAGLEVVYDQVVPIRVSEAGLEVVYDQQVPVRVSLVGIEVIYLGKPSGRRVFAEIVDS